MKPIEPITAEGLLVEIIRQDDNFDDRSISHKKAIAALKTYAKAFAEWTNSNGIRNGQHEWLYRGDNWRKKRTTEELISFFEQSTTNNCFTPL